MEDEFAIAAVLSFVALVVLIAIALGAGLLTGGQVCLFVLIGVLGGLVGFEK